MTTLAEERSLVAIAAGAQVKSAASLYVTAIGKPQPWSSAPPTRERQEVAALQLASAALDSPLEVGLLGYVLGVLAVVQTLSDKTRRICNDAAAQVRAYDSKKKEYGPHARLVRQELADEIYALTRATFTKEPL